MVAEEIDHDQKVMCCWQRIEGLEGVQEERLEEVKISLESPDQIQDYLIFLKNFGVT